MEQQRFLAEEQLMRTCTKWAGSYSPFVVRLSPKLVSPVISPNPNLCCYNIYRSYE